MQRKSDGTSSSKAAASRFPTRYRHLTRLEFAYAGFGSRHRPPRRRTDRQGAVPSLSPGQDQNANGLRRALDPMPISRLPQGCVSRAALTSLCARLIDASDQRTAQAVGILVLSGDRDGTAPCRSVRRRGGRCRDPNRRSEPRAGSMPVAVVESRSAASMTTVPSLLRCMR